MSLDPHLADDLFFDPPVIAHRGVSALAPENTLPAFDLAAQQGVRWVEADIKLSHDGVPIVIHDSTLDRTTSGSGEVSQTSWACLQKLDAGSKFSTHFEHTPIPRFSELIALVHRNNLRLNIELKPCPGRTQATVMVSMILAAQLWPEDAPPPLISSFDRESLIVAARLHPAWPRGLLLSTWNDDWAEQVKETQATAIHMPADHLNKERIEHLMQSNLPILAYTVNDPMLAKNLLHWGVRAVFSDNPAHIMKAL